jgi:thioredoxin reductase
MREKELMKGSRCVIILLGTDDNGNYLGCTSKIQGRPARNMLETMNHLWKTLVTQEEYENTSFCNYYRTMEEVKAPFQDGTIINLKLETCQTMVVHCPFYDQYKSKEISAEEFARLYVMTCKTWSYSTFQCALIGKGQMASIIVDQFFSKFEELVRKEPDMHGMDYVSHYLEIVKI